MQFVQVILNFLIIALVNAHQEEDNISIDKDLSLPKVVDLNSQRDLTNWEIKGSATLNNGRFLLTPEKSGRYEGSLWNKNFKLSKKSWTIDFVFRALGEIGKTGNGLVFWLLNDSRGNVERLVQADTGLYGGPTRFDGFAIAVDSNGPLGSTLSGYANDGTGTLTTDSPNFHKLAFGKCIIGYQNSQVPATIRISYDEFKHQFKVSIDNKICFETNQFKIPENENNFIVGVSAESGLSNKREAFEIFKIQVYKNILETEQKYSAVELAAQPVVVTEQGDGSQLQQPLGADKNDKPPSKPNQRPPMEAGQGSSRGFNREHLNQLTEQINGLDSKLEGKLKSYISKFTADNSQLNEKVHELTAQNTQLEAYLKEIDRKLHSMLLSEKDKKLEKENFRKAAIEKAASDKNSTEKVFNSIKTFIYILLVLIVGLGAFIYRLRGDIKHSKLLYLAFAVGPSDISTASEYSESISSYGTNESGGNNNELLNFSSVDYLYDTLNNSINSNNGILDKALVIQAQTSGMLKAKSMELKALEEEVSKKLENLKSTVNGSNGSRESFKEIFNDSHKKLLWCERHLKTTQEAVESKYPIEFNEGKEHVITRNVDYS